MARLGGFGIKQAWAVVSLLAVSCGQAAREQAGELQQRLAPLPWVASPELSLLPAGKQDYS